MFKNDERSFRSFGIFIDVIALAIAWFAAFQGFSKFLEEESGILHLYMLFNFIPAIWFTWFICRSNKTSEGSKCWLVLIPLIISIVLWAIAAIPLFEDYDEFIFALVVYLLVFIADGVWELLKPTRKTTSAKTIPSIVLFFVTLAIYQDVLDKLIGYMGLLDELNPFTFHKYALYGLLIFFVGHIVLNIAQNVATIKDQSLKEPEVKEVYVNSPASIEENIVEDVDKD